MVGCCFRRPLFSILESVFEEISERARMSDREVPRQESWDEVAMMVLLSPLMYTYLKARIDPEVSVTDASPTGGGAATAVEFQAEPCTIERDPAVCAQCGKDIPGHDRYPCPAVCGATLCSLSCVLTHREGEVCPRSTWRIPKFGERFAGRRAPLSHAVAMVGKVEVQPPYDWFFGDNFFTPEGKQSLADLMDDPCLAVEHWAPECKLFSRARGRPITLRDGRRVQGPQPVRDAHHVMGYPWLKADMKARVRRSNQMVLKALKRGHEDRRGSKVYWSCEHPRRSWMWEFRLVKEMEAWPEMKYSIASHCCFGGERVKWFAILSDLPSLQRHLSMDCPGHPGLRSYEVEELPDGTLRFDTEEEAEYPWEMCVAYARAVREQIEADGQFEAAVAEAREAHFLEEMALATNRLADADVAGPMAESLALKEIYMIKGREKEHLSSLLRHATYRGSDVRSFLEVDGQMHEQPYLATRWQWRTVMSYAWRQEAHINELELLAVAVFLKRRARTRAKQHLRFFHVLDSMVSRGVLAKGRSSSRRLNKVARRCSAYMLAMDNYMFPLWTISRWNFADKASRAHET